MKADLLQKAKGLAGSLAEGIKHLFTINEKLSALGKEGERSRENILQLQKIVERLLGKLEEMEKRIGERSAEFDKRLADVERRTGERFSDFDRRLLLEIRLAVRTEVDERLPPRWPEGPER